MRERLQDPIMRSLRRALPDRAAARRRSLSELCYIALAASDETIAKRLFFPTDRETFKQIATQAALELLRKKLIEQRTQSFRAKSRNPVALPLL